MMGQAAVCRWALVVLALVLAAPGLAGRGLAQDLGVAVSQVVVVDTEKVFKATVLGRDIATRLEERVKALAAENKKIASELEAEELDLTAKRPTLPPEEFKALADAFDEKVQRIRAEQDAKQRELQALRDAERQSFIEDIGPILSRVAAERGALVVLDLRNVVLSAGSIDITDEAIRQINAATTRRKPAGGSAGGGQRDPAAAGGDGAAGGSPAGDATAGGGSAGSDPGTGAPLGGAQPSGSP